jgi:hypothetical protein
MGSFAVVAVSPSLYYIYITFRRCTDRGTFRQNIGPLKLGGIQDLKNFVIILSITSESLIMHNRCLYLRLISALLNLQNITGIFFLMLLIFTSLFFISINTVHCIFTVSNLSLSLSLSLAALPISSLFPFLYFMVCTQFGFSGICYIYDN